MVHYLYFYILVQLQFDNLKKKKDIAIGFRFSTLGLLIVIILFPILYDSLIEGSIVAK